MLSEAELLWLSGQRESALEELLWSCFLKGLPQDHPTVLRIVEFRDNLKGA